MRNRKSVFQDVRGVTLLEFLVALAVMGILLSLAVPVLGAFRRSQARAVAADRLALALHYARHEAVTRSARVVLCPSIDGDSCVTGSGRWEEGWIVFVDGNGDFVRDPDEPLLRVGHGAGNGITVRAGANFRDGLAYLPLGNSRGRGGLATGTFRVCDGSGTGNGLSLIVARGGRVRRDRGTSQCP